MTASAADAATVTMVKKKSYCISKSFINGNPTLINGAGKLGNPPFWLIFLVICFNKISLFSKNLIKSSKFLFT